MDSISILALTVIAAVPTLFVAARIFLDPTTGLCLWVLLLPVTKTLAEFVGYPGGAECAGNCNVLQKLTLSDLVLLLTLAGLLNEKRSAGATYDRVSILAVTDPKKLPSLAEGFDRLVTTNGLDIPITPKAGKR